MVQLILTLVLLLGIISLGTCEQQQPRIVIVGAGMSGLSAAEKLQQEGFTNYIILEAMDRIGGRIRTIDFGDGWVEMGAQWIHGVKGNIVYDYAAKHNLVHPEIDFSFLDMEFLTDTQWNIDQNKTKDLFMMLMKKLEKFPADVEKNLTIDKYLENVLNTLPKSGLTTDQHFRKKFLEWFEEVQSTLSACESISEETIESQLQFEDLEGGNINLNQGYTKVVNVIASNILNKSIELNSPVEKIEVLPETNTSNTKTSSEKPKKPIVVIGRDGSKHEADHVIVTVSLGVLKQKATTLFEPQLSKEKMTAIQNMGFGTVNKIYLEFDEAFWPNTTKVLSLIWISEPSLTGMRNTWPRKIHSFNTVPFASNVLSGWIVGKESRYMESQSNEQVKTATIEVLKKFVPRQLPNVKSMTRSSWFSNEFTRGSYSYLNVHAPNSSVANNILAEPVYQTINGVQQPIILFAGEATNEKHFSTVHGARESGIREAERIIGFYGKSTSGSSSRWNHGAETFIAIVTTITLISFI